MGCRIGSAFEVEIKEESAEGHNGVWRSLPPNTALRDVPSSTALSVLASARDTASAARIRIWLCHTFNHSHAVLHSTGSESHTDCHC